ncbi:MAG: ABC transporter ATP-binding protein [Firmicutes bacterium]|nr:ABC transporter ATP-binding protein [Bacillota bacterium]MBQ6013333.1 ABC transporter ATP-binding protein [Bacillota bacterium]MBQ6260533.1 ABC transporter ATP-binding protein [Bacillota bacterium]MBR0521751.1 ABC transporter ATP-binding protein [Bacillota bacterium]
MIEVRNLTKLYGDHAAVSDLSFTIEKGQIYGFLGPNGAGKSTTMNIMTGCLAATSGEVKIGGYDIVEEPQKAKKLIGYLPELPPLYPDQTPKEYLEFVAEAKGVPRSKAKEQIAHAMQVTQIDDVQNRLCKNLSKGYRQRVGIAQALLGDPEVIILDEPTVGLDPKQIIEIRDLIRELGKEHTVILSSHILSEVQAVCETILIINKGKLVACDTAENLENFFSGRFELKLTADCGKDKALELVSAVEGLSVDDADENDGKTVLTVTTQREDTDQICRELFFSFSGAQTPILSMSAAKASLEDVFMKLTQGEDEDAAEQESAEEAQDQPVSAEDAQVIAPEEYKEEA